jgi:D-arabinonate dehydratase
MKIADIRFTGLTGGTVEGGWAEELAPEDNVHTVVEVVTDAGLVGVGSVFTSSHLVGAAVKLLRPFLVGERADEPARVSEKLRQNTFWQGRGGSVEHAISGIDIALWDIAGKVAKLPVYKLLGAARDRVEAYASGGFYQEGKGIDGVAGEAEGYRARGFKGMKMKIGRNPSTQTHLRELIGNKGFCEVDPSEDIARVAAVRQALGPHAKLMVDVNCAWSPAFAIEMGRAMEPYNLYWIEEPVATDDIDGSAAVAAALATPIAGYETEMGLYAFRELIGRGAVDIVQLDIAWSGGFSEGRRIAAYAGAHHRMVAPHAFAGAVLLVASLHFAAAIPNGLVLEWDQNPNAIRDELLKEPLRLESDGTVKLPERPGLGIELDRSAVERYRVG